EGRDGISAAFGRTGPLGYAEVVLRAAGAILEEGDDDSRVPAGSVRARTITPDDALLEYLADHGLRRVSKRLVASGIVDLVAGAVPGIRDILVLGKVKQIERARLADVVLVDAPATGHTLTFLSSASGLLDAARGGPIRSQAADVVDLLSDPSRCQVVLVTLPEEMPVNEVVDAAFALEDRIGVALGPIIVNGCLAPLPAAETPATAAAAQAGLELGPEILRALEEARTFRLVRQRLQEEQLARLAQELPLEQLRLPYLFAPSIGPAEVDLLRDALSEGVRRLRDPAGVSA
ncbi:MAG TPA: ArsA-related P-loop ATPase, partial [Acidimicrobiales bacterium]|nr:ArsA-related P-loop ATPase [Acidimicrobiales bacterium]